MSMPAKDNRHPSRAMAGRVLAAGARSPLGAEVPPTNLLRALDAEATESTVLRERLVSEIQRNGPMTFCRFMERVLYDPEEGYYRFRPAIGARGDYLTSPELHPLFGALLARQVEQFWELLERPEAFRLIEIGPGNGTLARGLLGALVDSPCRNAVRPILIESSAAGRAIQAATLGALAHGVSWLDDTSGLAVAAGDIPAELPAVLLSNELVDSFPVHRVLRTEGVLRELFVDFEGGELVDRPGPLSTPDLAAYFERLGLLPGEGCVAEVNLEALSWMRSVAAVVRRGFVLTLDYGYDAVRLYAPWRRAGTLLCFYRHAVSSDPYRRLGRQDMTTHVDFTSLSDAGAKFGLEPLGLTSQREFLAALGAGEALRGGPSAAPSLEEYLSRRRAVEALLDEEGLGRIRVFAQGAGLGQVALAGFPTTYQAPADA